MTAAAGGRQPLARGDPARLGRGRCGAGLRGARALRSRPFQPGKGVALVHAAQLPARRRSALPGLRVARPRAGRGGDPGGGARGLRDRILSLRGRPRARAGQLRRGAALRLLRRARAFRVELLPLAGVGGAGAHGPGRGLLARGALAGAAAGCGSAGRCELLVYLPVVFLVFAFVRNATGTDESLQFAISPWPAVPVFGIEVAALFVAAWLAGTGVGALAIARKQRAGGPGAWLRLLAGLLLAIALPVLLLWIGSQLGLFPFRAGARTFQGVALVTALSIALVGGGAPRRRPPAGARTPPAGGCGADRDPAGRLGSHGPLRLLPDPRDPRSPDHRRARRLLPTRDGVS